MESCHPTLGNQQLKKGTSRNKASGAVLAWMQMQSPQSREPQVSKALCSRDQQGVHVVIRDSGGRKSAYKEMGSMCQGDSMSKLSEFKLPHHTENSSTIILTKELGGMGRGTLTQMFITLWVSPTSQSLQGRDSHPEPSMHWARVLCPDTLYNSQNTEAHVTSKAKHSMLYMATHRSASG